MNDSFNLKDHSSHYSQEKINDSNDSFQNNEENLEKSTTTQKSEIKHTIEMKSTINQFPISLERSMVKAPESHFLPKPVIESRVITRPSTEPEPISSLNQAPNAVKWNKEKNKNSHKKLLEKNKIMIQLIGVVAAWQFVYYLVYW